ncbi:MAG TPA: hypothetical protein VET23_08600 [Chitinophagaceae bacterium]|nr:hypothetical protein [Chitinophagaceae bacterium]
MPAVAVFLLLASSLRAQGDPGPGKNSPAVEKKESKPFKILTSGKRITIQSIDNNNSLKQILVWTSSGHRIVEQHELDVSSYAFSVSAINEKIFFLMVELQDGKHFSEKFGVR